MLQNKQKIDPTKISESVYLTPEQLKEIFDSQIEN